jgi:ubiquinone/menaquinone biosynthesis C-methylase UbiE
MGLLRRLFFNLMYYRNPPWDTGISPPELMQAIQTNPPGKALDLGCGTGTNVITLAKNGWQVTGVDFAPRAIALARRKISQAGVQADLRVGDVTNLEGVAGPFDLILDIGCFHSLDKTGRPAYLQNIRRLLSQSGIFLLYAFFTSTDKDGPGLDAEDLQALTSQLKLESRKDGIDTGRGRPSAWFTLRNTQERT